MRIVHTERQLSERGMLRFRQAEEDLRRHGLASGLWLRLGMLMASVGGALLVALLAGLFQR